MGRMHPVEISAGLLHLRPWTLAELDDLVAARSDEEIVRWGDLPEGPTREDCTERIENGWPAGWAEGTTLHWAVLDSVTARALGAVSLHAVDPVDAVWAVGTWSAPWARRQRVAATAVAAACRFAFGGLDAQRVEWFAAAANTASQGLALTVGFRPEGVQRARLSVMGDPTRRADAWLASMLPGEL